MKTLPNQPNLEFLRREARAIKARHRAGDMTVCEIIGHFDTSMHGFSPDEVLSSNFSIIDAQRVTARQYAFASWTRLKLFVQKSSTTNDFDTELSESILKRKRVYDALLKRYKKTKWRNDAISKFDDFNKESGDIFRAIYEQNGWPGPHIVGREGVEASFYLVASNTYDSEFQNLTAELMEKALPNGECFGIMYASITDRSLSLAYKPNVFGTSPDFNEQTGRVELSRNVVDPENLNKRRAEVGLPDFETQNREGVEKEIKRGQLQTDREDWIQHKRKVALKGGYIQA